MIFENQSIFIFGLSRFDGPIESTSYTTAKFLAQRNDVFYIDFPYTYKKYFERKQSIEKVQYDSRKYAFFSSKYCLLDTEIARLKVLIVPPICPINFLPEGLAYKALLELNEQIIVRRIRKVIKRFGIQEFIFINSFNFHHPNVGRKLKSSLLVYHCVDPLVANYDRRHGLISEEKIVIQSDLVICTSKQLHREKSHYNENTFFIPNAADLNHCLKALDEKLTVFGPLKSIKKPIVGYFGNIERRIDFDLLQKVAERNPDKSFVFAGPVNEGDIPAEFRKMPNVFFLGPIAYADMPSVLKGFDVAIIPFKRDEVSSTIFPLKLFEYLGAGKAVVSSDFNLELREFTADTVLFCKDEREFSDALDISLGLLNDTKITDRLRIASENTWERRLTEFSELLAACYEKKNHVREIVNPRVIYKQKSSV